MSDFDKNKYERGDISFEEYTEDVLKYSREYWNKRAEGYSHTIHDELNDHEDQYWRRLFRKYAPVEEYNTALDVGCGPGYFSIILAGMGYDATGIDLTDEMIKKAKSNLEEFDISAKIMQMDAMNLTFPDNTFDLLVSRNVTWNLPDPERAYSEWLRVLKPGGILINYDANHYLHYHDDDYAAYKKKKNDTYHKYMDGVDPTLINEIGGLNSISKVHRPDWDLSALLRLGVSSVTTDILLDSYTENDPPKRLIDRFLIIATK